MAFDSFPYLCLLLPAVLAGVSVLIRWGRPAAIPAWLMLGSLLFLGLQDWLCLPLAVASAVLNYGLGLFLLERGRMPGPRPLTARLALAAGILANLMAMAWLRRAGPIAPVPSLLPHSSLVPGLAVAVLTLRQIGFLLECARARAPGPAWPDYGLFVLFFPQWLVGPISRPRELMAQVQRLRVPKGQDHDRAGGLLLLALGLFKKTMVADPLLVWANAGFEHAASLSFVDAWLSALANGLQVYFEFSGLTDMALGSALMLQVRLPPNFDSPYKACDIWEFWRRWHITLGAWLEAHVYGPVAGGAGRTVSWRRGAGLGLVFLLGGLWHGAGASCLAWTLWHALAALGHALWRRASLRLYRPLAWSATFLVITGGWVIFRARDLGQALEFLRAMAGLSGFHWPQESWGTFPSHIPSKAAVPIALCLLAVGLLPNSNEIARRFKADWRHFLLAVLALLFGLLAIREPRMYLYLEF